jgi:TetR/AcrR family transcriptional regulator, cholesterol catabolism regulator
MDVGVESIASSRSALRSGEITARAIGSSTLDAVVDEPDADAARQDRDERYRRLMVATRKAARRGYDAVSMRDIARSTRMSMTTIYQYCSSKDHLIAEAHLEWMENFRSGVLEQPPRGRSAASRVSTYIDQITSAWERHPVLTMTLQRAIYSMDPGARDVRAATAKAYAEFMDIAIGDEDVPNRSTVIEIIGHVIDSVTYRWVTGGMTHEEASRVLHRAVHTLLPKPSSPSRAGARR